MLLLGRWLVFSLTGLCSVSPLFASLRLATVLCLPVLVAELAVHAVNGSKLQWLMNWGCFYSAEGVVTARFRSLQQPPAFLTSASLSPVVSRRSR